MNRISGYKEIEYDGKKFKNPIFKYDEDCLVSIFRFLSKYDKINELLKLLIKLKNDVEKNNDMSFWEIIEDSPREEEKQLPSYLREDTGFYLGKIILLMSVEHEQYIYFRVETSQVFLLHYAGSEIRLKIYDFQDFFNLLNEWNEIINNDIRL